MPKYYVTRKLVTVYEVEVDSEYGAHIAAYAEELRMLGNPWNYPDGSKKSNTLIQHECFDMTIEEIPEHAKED